MPRLHRALVATFVVGALGLLIAFGLTAAKPAPSSEALAVIELPRVVIHGQRLRSPAPAVAAPTDTSAHARPLRAGLSSKES